MAVAFQFGVQMTAARLTAAEARTALAKRRYEIPDAVTPRRRTTRKAVPRAGYRSTCHTCAAVFTTDAAETRHVNATGHARYESETR